MYQLRTGAFAYEEDLRVLTHEESGHRTEKLRAFLRSMSEHLEAAEVEHIIRCVSDARIDCGFEPDRARILLLSALSTLTTPTELTLNDRGTLLVLAVRMDEVAAVDIGASRLTAVLAGAIVLATFTEQMRGPQHEQLLCMVVHQLTGAKCDAPMVMNAVEFLRQSPQLRSLRALPLALSVLLLIATKLQAAELKEQFRMLRASPAKLEVRKFFGLEAERAQGLADHLQALEMELSHSLRELRQALTDVQGSKE